ncbi:DUF1192 domain-containing protein [Hyphobacterium sp.]|jgi:uncharacterized small protein (DUF1192 family)|uniref:DUF1192 domain-containing protein n=1 Tax=Hyphobacterium sp. TaxID=2004662 RepID=UPI003BA975CA
MFEDDAAPVRDKAAIVPGEDLSAFSIEALEERKQAIQDEIGRIDAMIASKQSGREAAESFFKKT